MLLIRLTMNFYRIFTAPNKILENNIMPVIVRTCQRFRNIQNSRVVPNFRKHVIQCSRIVFRFLFKLCLPSPIIRGSEHVLRCGSKKSDPVLVSGFKFIFGVFKFFDMVQNRAQNILIRNRG